MISLQTTRTVLLLSADPELLQRGRRIIAAAGNRPVVADAAECASNWADADAVLVGIDQLAMLVKIDPHRREGVYVVASEQVPDKAWRDCVALGATDAVVLEESEAWLVDRLSLSRSGAPSGLVVRVRGATGGCGTSTTAAGLALAAHGEPPSLLVDTDLRGGWLDLALGIDADGLGWSELGTLRGRVAGEALAASIPSRDGVALIASDRDRAVPELSADALRATVLAAAGLGATVVIDDAGRDELDEVLGALSDVTVLVTVSDLRGGLAARRVLEPRSPNAARDGRERGPMVVAARTPRGSALPTAVFRELTAEADDCYWLRELPRAARRVAAGRPALRADDRFVRDCAGLLGDYRTEVGS